MRLAVVGCTGQVARSLQEQAALRDVEVVAFGRPEVDLARADTIEAALRGAAPDAVVNAAGHTAVDQAEGEEALAFALNRDGARAVAATAADLGVPVVHLSTDYVFDGAKQSPYRENDPVGPRTAYGRSKLAGERAVAAANPRHFILRTSWVYAPFGVNFVRTMLRLARERDHVRVVDDQVGCPTYAPDLADALLLLAQRFSQGAPGLYHLAGPDAMSWCEFARRIFAVSKAHGGPAVPVHPIATAEFPLPTPRPANSRLDSTKMLATFGIALPSADDALQRCVARLLTSRGTESYR
jgi:dTDP-4-dehydrorhamnose reductase